ncbi:U2 snRNP component prp10 [Saitoella coloradoensis]
MADEFETIRLLQQERNAANAGPKKEDGQRTATSKVSLSSAGEVYDTDIYNSSKSKFDGYDTSIGVGGDDDMDLDGGEDNTRRLVGQYTAPRAFLNEYVEEDALDLITARQEGKQIQDRQGDYQKRRFDRELSPTRQDAFTGNGVEGRSYAEVMKQAELEREEQRVLREIERRRQDGTLEDHAGRSVHSEANLKEASEEKPAKKRRWDVGGPTESAEEPKKSSWADVDETPRTTKRSRWDQTPAPMGIVPSTIGGENPVGKRSRWDQTPAPGQTLGATPAGLGAAHTPFGALVAQSAISDEDLDEMLPKEGYRILEPPPGYMPIRTPVRKLMATPAGPGGFVMQEVDPTAGMQQAKALPTEIPGVGDLAFFKQEDMKYFGKLMDTKEEGEMSMEELKERKIMRLLLKVKNGTPPMRKTALRQLTDKAREFGAAALFNQILPLLMERTLEDQERHLLVKVIDRILYKLDDLVRPFTHKILVVIEPLLIDEDYYARVEGREIISNLAKAAGLAHMISTMRPDIDHVDEYVRNTTARAFAVVASALGIPALLPFLRAVCRSKKSWQARHTGVKIVQQIAILMGCAILPHLKNLVDCIANGLDDEQQKVRTITALATAALAEAAAPYGIESFDSVLKPLWTGIRKHRGKGLAAFLKAIGYIIPLMDAEYANYYTKEVMIILIREFQSPDEEMRKIVLKVVQQCSATEGVSPGYLKEEVLPDFFRNFWTRRMAADKRMASQVIETTVELAQKVGAAEVVERVVDHLKDENEMFRKMVVETIEKVIAGLGAADVGEKLEERLIDGVLYAFQEQTTEGDNIMLKGFGTVVNALGTRCKPYLPQIVSTILWRLNNKNAKVRQQSADLISHIAVVMKQCGEEALMGKLGVVLYEYLGEEYPEVLGSILGALKSIVNVVGMTSMTPPIKDLLPRLTPILRNRHEKVQENTIDLVGRIADRGSEFVSAREWMRICFELLDMLKAHKKGIRRAAVNTFGYIAKAIGPQDVLATLLNNLKVQERQNRVCTTVAIAIVAETCAPFTVLPALMNEYRVPELNVQNGVLKSLSFLFEYIGELAKDYVYAVTPLLEDALTDRDQVHRQTAATTIKHMALGCVGLGVEDAMLHLLNLLWPNILETSPHVINAVTDAIDAIRTCIGPGVMLMYLLQGLFHPARKVREVYWKLWNNAYVQQADAMIPYFPNVEDEERPAAQFGQTVKNTYQRHELMIML